MASSSQHAMGGPCAGTWRTTPTRQARLLLRTPRRYRAAFARRILRQIGESSGGHSEGQEEEVIEDGDFERENNDSWEAIAKVREDRVRTSNGRTATVNPGH